MFYFLLMDKYFVPHSFWLADNVILHKLELYVLYNFLSIDSEVHLDVLIMEKIEYQMLAFSSI